MPIYLICGSGSGSLAMTTLLMRTGYDAYSVSSGTGAWAGAGRPLVMGSRRNAA
jgi:rhodanese-related sulfurtransferase